MQRLLDAAVFSASDLNHFLACEHLTTLDLARLEGLLAAPAEDDANLELVSRKGLEHERAFLDSLRQAGRHVVELSGRWTTPTEALERTLAAMRSGTDYIYQAAFWDGPWRGLSDFLKRVDQPSELGAWRYEVMDTKLARSPKPYFLLQLCFYSELLARLQGVPPAHMHVVLGGGGIETYRVDDFAAYYRRVKGRFEQWIAAPERQTRALPVEHCSLCHWASHCEATWQAEDHPSLVANIRRSQIAKLEAAGLATLAALAQAGPGQRPPDMAVATFETLRHQARLQLHHRTTREHRYELLAHEAGRGFALLPRPDAGDVFFDMEGDPFVDGGLEYLFGFVHREAADWTFTPLWAHDRLAERRAFEQFIDFVVERRARFPGMHVYHYAAYEESALKRLASQHGTREEAVDQLLRDGVLVDLYRVVRQGLRISQPSYSIKKLETFYMDARAAEVKTAGDSIVAYENWLETGDAGVLADIARYNEEDCISTRLLRDWLLERRGELEGTLGMALPWPEASVGETTPEMARAIAETGDRILALVAGVPDDPSAWTPEQCARCLLADLLDYHRREDKPVWWAFFNHCAMSDDELVADGEAIGGLRPDGSGPVRQEKKSLVWRLRFDAQDHKLRVGATVYDPATGERAGEIADLDEQEGWLELKRGPKLDGAPLPRALFPHELIQTREQRQALQRLADEVGARGVVGPGRYRALRDLLQGELPRVAGRALGAPLQGEVPTMPEIQAIARALDESTLVVQGPPGAGKTYTGARVIVDLLAHGRRVGVAATSHRAIHNLLAEIEVAAKEAGVSFEGLKKCTAGNDETRFESATGMIGNADKSDDARFQSARLVAGTAWLFARDDFDATLDVLVLDEAGQISLADALAMGTSARNLILLGDPQQLPQVVQGVHPRGSGCSVLEHLLAGADTVPPERGLFLARSWRMHPRVTAYISGLAYENRLLAADGCEHQRLDVPGYPPAGLCFVPVAHAGNGQASREEAREVAAIVERLLGTPHTTKDDTLRQLAHDDVLVVAPYNLQVDMLRRHLPPAVRVGTVDKFQGQEAPVVIFSMATSSGEDMPRNLDFLFNRNRLNVAISRAKCLAILVACPALLDVRCNTVEQMRLVNALCRFAEVASAHAE